MTPALVIAIAAAMLGGSLFLAAYAGAVWLLLAVLDRLSPVDAPGRPATADVDTDATATRKPAARADAGDRAAISTGGPNR